MQRSKKNVSAKTKQNKNNKNNNNSMPQRRRAKRTRKPKPGSMIYAPTSMSSHYSSRVPKLSTFQTKGRLACRIQHREIIGNVTRQTGVPYELLYSLPINPGMAATFPWLSTQAANWEQYSIHSLTVQYVPRCSTSVSGSITLGPDYDANDAPPSSSKILGSYQDSIDGPAWSSAEIRLDKEAMMTPALRKYIRNGPRPLEDIKTYDCGVIYMTADGTTSTNEWGILWINYDITFYIPSLEGGSNALVVSPSQSSRFSHNTDVTLTSGTPLSINWSNSEFNLLAVGGTLPTTGLVPLNGAYFVTVQFVLLSDAITAITVSGTWNVGTATGWWTPLAATYAVPGVLSTYSMGTTGVFLGDGVKTITFTLTVTGTGVLTLRNSSIVFLPC